MLADRMRMGASGEPYDPVSVHFDGINDYLIRGADLTGLSDGPEGTIAFWFKVTGGAGTTRKVLSNTNEFFTLQLGSDNRLQLVSFTSISGALNNFKSSVISSSVWHHCVLSFNGTTQHMYIDGVSDITSTVNNAGNTDYTRGNFTVGIEGAGGSNYWDGDMADVYFTDEYVDLSSVPNLAKFITAELAPVYLGSDGSTPTGTAAIVMLQNELATWHTNTGTGGGFTEVGELTAGSPVT